MPLCPNSVQHCIQSIPQYNHLFKRQTGAPACPKRFYHFRKPGPLCVTGGHTCLILSPFSEQGCQVSDIAI